MLILITLYLLFVLPFLIRSLLLLGANIYRSGQTNSAPPQSFEIPRAPRFRVAVQGNGQAERDDDERLPDV